MKRLLAIAFALLTLFTLTLSTGCSDKKLVGFDVDLATALADKLGLEIEFKEIDWDTKETELETGKIDCVWNGFTYTEDRDNGYVDADGKKIGGLDFTGFYMKNKQAAVVKKENAAAAANPAWYADKKGCAEASSAGEEVIKSLLKTKCSSLDRQLSIFTEVEAGTSDFGVMDSVMAEYYANSENSAYNGRFAVVEISGAEEEFYAVAFKEGSNLKEVFNYTLNALYADGTAAKIAERYGLKNALYDGFQSFSDEYTLPTEGAFKALKEKGKIVVGYTLFAPIAYFA